MTSRGPLRPGEWLEVFARIGGGVRRAVLPLSGTEAGRAPLSVGAGGDTTMELDARAEQVVFTELAHLAEREKFSVLSEEAGLRNFGADFPLVLVDPVDGSLNAKQGVPLFGLMLAVLDGPTLDDAHAAFVLNLNTGEEWKAVRAQGAWRDGRALQVMPRVDSGGRIELLGLESTPRALKLAQPLVERASKIRILGSMALSIALTSAGAFDVFCAPIPVRVFDTAASLLILRETKGVASTLGGEPLGRLTCDLSTRSTLLCAPTRELHKEALGILDAAR